MEHVHYGIRNRIAILTLENPPVNALSAAVQERVRDAIRQAVSAASVDAIVLTGAGNTFVAGGDIRLLQQMARGEAAPSMLPQILMEIEASPKPVVAAIMGTALGGGLELALASHYRIATPNAKIGQPEVQLGLIPGAGGTQRLPRLAGVELALEMCVFGAPISAENAKRFGLVDRLAEGDLLEAATGFATEVIPRGTRPTRQMTGSLGTRESNARLFAAYREKVRRVRRNQLAPEAAIDAIEAATELPFEEGCRKERETFTRLLGSAQARALIHVFFAERAARKIPGLVKDAPVLPIRTAAIVGSGTMGRGIAMCFANAGVPVVLKDTKPEALDKAMKSIEAAYQSSVRKGRVSSAETQLRLSRITAQLDYASFDTADIVVEAAFENLETKKAVFAELAGITTTTAILATNTSYLDIDEIARTCSRPRNVIGLHFFSPAQVMRLVEVVPGDATDGAVTATVLGLAKRLGKLPVVAGNCRGFIGNRMLRVYRQEALRLLEEGASPLDVDSALEDWGMAMGPFAVQDMAGLDIAMSSRRIFAALEPPEARHSEVMDALYARGRLGQKTGAGWYRYDENRRAMPDPEVESLIEHASREHGITRRSISPEEIVERTIYALINEGAQILEKGCALRASDIDLVYINGYGFPAYRGGPMHYADEIGLNAVRSRIRGFCDSHGIQWKASRLLDRLADEGGSFEAWDSEQFGTRASEKSKA